MPTFKKEESQAKLTKPPHKPPSTKPQAAKPHRGVFLLHMEDAGVDDVARWLVESVELPQYEQAFRENKVDGDVLLDLVARDLLGHLADNPLHQSRIRAAVTKYARVATGT